MSGRGRLKWTRDEKRTMLADRYDAFLLDLDGVLLVGDEPVPGAVSAVERLRDRGVPLRVVTNNSRSTRERVAEGLASAGMAFDPDEVYTAARATAAYLAETDHERVSVVGHEGFETEIRRHGLAVIDDPEENGGVGNAGKRSGVDGRGEDGVDAVAVGMAVDFDYDDLTRATRRVLAGADLVAANVDASYPVADGVAPGTGSIVAAISTAAATEPIVVGKPEPRLFSLALEGLDAERPAMIGDTQTSDIAGAARAGIDALLVADERPETGPSPDAVIGELGELFDPGNRN